MPRVGARRTQQVAAGRETAQAKLSEIVRAGGRSLHRHAPPAHVAELDRFHRDVGVQLAELVADSARQHAPSRQRQVDTLQVLARGDGDGASGFARISLAVLQREKPRARERDGVAARRDLADFEFAAGVGDARRCVGPGSHGDAHAVKRLARVSGDDATAQGARVGARWSGDW
jgi:hypothetical protein